MPNVERKRTRDIWRGMNERCYNPRHSSFPRYGGKGVTVCDRWRTSFENFLADIGYIPEGLTLDRKDNSKGYEPSNVRLATLIEQNNNKSNVRFITFRGKTQHMRAWAAETGLSSALLHYRIVRCNWPIEIALTAPITPRHERHLITASVTRATSAEIK